MSLLFVCNKCKCVDLVCFAYKSNELPPQISEQLCFYCQNGHEHNCFDRERYDPVKHDVCNPAAA